MLASSSLESVIDEKEREKEKIISRETQLAQLGPFQPKSQEHLTHFGEVSSNAAVFRQIFLQARKLNYNISDLEVVLVGLKNQGKSSVLQAVLGFPLPIGPTKRAINCHLVNDPSLTKPRFLIKRQSEDVVCPSLEVLVSKLKAENRARNEPLSILIEYCWGFDLTIIDTPAIRNLNDMAVWARPAMTGVSNRFIVAIESAKPSKDLKVYQWLKHFDPSLSRSALILTGFDEFLTSFQSRPRAALFHFEEMESVPCFWTTLPSDEVAQDCNLDADLFKLRVWQYYARDLDAIRLLDLDYSRNRDQIGIYNFRKSLNTIFETDLHRHIPSLSRTFEQVISSYHRQLETSQNKIKAWVTDNIRAQASEYTSYWLRHFDDLLKGSVSGRPSSNGQTLEEELEDYYRWESRYSGSTDEEENAYKASLLLAAGGGRTDLLSQSNQNIPISNGHEPIRLNKIPKSVSSMSLARQFTSNIPSADVKLYGAPQLLRLLDEFSSAARTMKMPSVSESEMLSTVDSAWAASEIARRKIEEQFLPLVELLLSRAFFIMRKMSSLCDIVAEKTTTTDESTSFSDSNAPLKKPNVISQKKFPAFSTLLRQTYATAQMAAYQKCLDICKQEFFGSLIIYWELTSDIDPLAGIAFSTNQHSQMNKSTGSAHSGDSHSRFAHVVEIATKIYSQVKERLIDSFALNVRSFFLSQNATLMLMKQVAAEVSTLNEATIRDIFKVDQVKDELQDHIKTVQAELKELETLKTTFLNQLIPQLGIKL